MYRYIDSCLNKEDICRNACPKVEKDCSAPHCFKSPTTVEDMADLSLQHAKDAWVLKNLILCLKENKAIKDDALDRLVQGCYDRLETHLKENGF
jgi:hypothetical protein